MKKNVGILGIGEVDKAIKKLAEKKFKVYCKDVDFDEIGRNKIDVLHICIPYTKKFIKIVVENIKKINPQLVIINSTIELGATRKIFKKTNILIAHVPIMGVHPNLAKYQKMFTKTIGAVNSQSFKSAKKHWEKLGAKKIVKFDRPEETELAKLLSTTYYLTNIIFNKTAKKLTDKSKADFKQVYWQFNEIYNEGYKQVDKNLQRQILKYMAGPIGGHCVISNAEILNKAYKDSLIDFLLRFNAKLKK